MHVGNLCGRALMRSAVLHPSCSLTPILSPHLRPQVTCILPSSSWMKCPTTALWSKCQISRQRQTPTTPSWELPALALVDSTRLKAEASDHCKGRARFKMMKQLIAVVVCTCSCVAQWLVATAIYASNSVSNSKMLSIEAYIAGACIL